MNSIFNNRRNFLKATGIYALGMSFLSPQTLKASAEMQKNKEHCKWWINTLLEKMKESRGDSLRAVESVGRECANSHVMEKVRSMKSKLNSQKPEVLVKTINSDIFGIDLLRYENGIIIATWDKCYCPTRAGGYITSGEFCNCTVGFVKELLETSLDREVDVRLMKAIGRGDKYCEIVTKI